MSTVPDDPDTKPEPTSKMPQIEAGDESSPEDSFERTLAGLYPRVEFTAEEKEFLRRSGLV